MIDRLTGFLFWHVNGTCARNPQVRCKTNYIGSNPHFVTYFLIPDWHVGVFDNLIRTIFDTILPQNFHHFAKSYEISLSGLSDIKLDYIIFRRTFFLTSSESSNWKIYSATKI